MRKVSLIVVFMCISLVFIACGAKKDQVEPTNSSQTQMQAEPAAEGEGVLLAKEILSVFDEAVVKVGELAKDKPEPAVLKPQLEELYKGYEIKMSELNVKYLALRDKDSNQFGICNGYVNDKRGQHVFKKDNDLGAIVAHYNLQVGDQEMVRLISTRVVELIDIAVNQNLP